MKKTSVKASKAEVGDEEKMLGENDTEEVSKSILTFLKTTADIFLFVDPRFHKAVRAGRRHPRVFSRQSKRKKDQSEESCKSECPKSCKQTSLFKCYGQQIYKRKIF